MTRKNKAVLFFVFATLGLITTYSACGQDYNSFSGDGSSLQIDCGNPANTQLCAAATALKNNGCYQCHGGWLSFTSSEAYEAAGLIDLGNRTQSPILSRLVNNGGNMPPSGAPLSAEDLNAVVDWVQGL